MIRHTVGRAGNHLFRVDGEVVAGAAMDRGRWSWWARSTDGRRVHTDTEVEAVRQAKSAAEVMDAS